MALVNNMGQANPNCKSSIITHSLYVNITGLYSSLVCVCSAAHTLHNFNIESSVSREFSRSTNDGFYILI